MSKRQTEEKEIQRGYLVGGKKCWNHSKQNDCSHSGLTSHQSQSIWISLLGYGYIFIYTVLEHTSKATSSICKHLQMHTFTRHIESLSIAILNSVVYIYQCKITALMHLYAPGHAHAHTHSTTGFNLLQYLFPTFFQDGIDCDITHTGCRSIVPACSFIGWVGAARLQAAILNHQSPLQIRAFTSKQH